MKDIHDVIKHAKFDDDRFRGSRVVAGQISAFPIDFAGRPYNTLTLPCERVIITRGQRPHAGHTNNTCPSNQFSMQRHVLQSHAFACILSLLKTRLHTTHTVTLHPDVALDSTA